VCVCVYVCIALVSARRIQTFLALPELTSRTELAKRFKAEVKVDDNTNDKQRDANEYALRIVDGLCCCCYYCFIIIILLLYDNNAIVIV